MMAAIYTGSTVFKKRFIQCLKASLILKIAFFILLIAALPFHSGEWSKALLKLKVRYIPDLVYAGCFMAYLAGLAAFPARLNDVKNLLGVPAFSRLVRWSASATFLFSAIAAIYFFDQSLAFFASCGYNKDFMIFIICIELLCGLMLLLPKTALYAALLLTCDMAGAIATHYHNYFYKHFPNPLGNSVPALVTLTLLISVIWLNSELKKVVENQA